MGALGKAAGWTKNAVLYAVKVHWPPRLRALGNYARVELMPPTPRDLPDIRRGFNNLVVGMATSRWRNLTINEAFLNTLVAIEIAMWFFAGEIIGRRHFLGYFVKP